MWEDSTVFYGNELIVGDYSDLWEDLNIIFCDDKLLHRYSSNILDLFELTPLETNFLCRQRLLLGPCQEGHEHCAGQPQQGQA